MMRLLALVMMASVVTKGCTITLGSDGSGDGSSGSPALNVPYVQQQNPEYCGPASILMWALYDHVENLTQTQIGAYIGASASTGSSPQAIASGVEHFTLTGKDAVLDYAGGESDEVSLFYSEEVTSINSEVPFIAIIGGATHAGVASGGSWHVDDTSGYYVWDTVIFQDPILGPGQVYVAGQWTAEDISHILSVSASEAAGTNLSHYGGKVELRGAGGGIGSPLPD